MNKLNINVVLCGNVNENATEFNCVFDEIKLQADSTLSFDMVTILSMFGDDKETQNFTLVHTFTKHDQANSGKIIVVRKESFVANLQMQKEIGKNGKVSSSNQLFDVAKFRNMFFPGTGSYAVEVYKFDEDISEEVFEEIKKTNKHDNKIVCVTGFNVV